MVTYFNGDHEQLCLAKFREILCPNDGRKISGKVAKRKYSWSKHLYDIENIAIVNLQFPIFTFYVIIYFCQIRGLKDQSTNYDGALITIRTHSDLIFITLLWEVCLLYESLCTCLQTFATFLYFLLWITYYHHVCLLFWTDFHVNWLSCLSTWNVVLYLLALVWRWRESPGLSWWNIW